MELEVFRTITRQISADAIFVLPEALLALGACLALLVDLPWRARGARLPGYIALLAITCAGLLLLELDPWSSGRALFRASTADGTPAQHGLLQFDPFANGFKLLLLASTAVAIILGFAHRQLNQLRTGEYHALLLVAALGLCLMAAASDLLMIVIAIEMVSLPSYVLVGYTKRSQAAAEASLKYVLYGSVASGITLYGFSLLYGLTGSTALPPIGLIAMRGDQSLVIGLVLLFSLAALAYKMSVVPFHFWTPDIYQGAPTPVTAFLAHASKAAGFAVFIRFAHACDSLPGAGAGGFDLTLLLALISAATMTIGNLGALRQTDVKRMLGYSSIAHAGYLLLGCVALSASPSADGLLLPGAVAMAFYLLAYLFLIHGAFAVVIAVESAHAGAGGATIAAYRGLIRREPLLAIAMAVALFGLIGVPPTGGFVAKFGLFIVALNERYLWLVVLAIVNTAISVVYYARLLREMILTDDGESPALPANPYCRAVALISVLGTLWLGVAFGGTLEIVRKMALPQPSLTSAPSAGVNR